MVGGALQSLRPLGGGTRRGGPRLSPRCLRTLGGPGARPPGRVEAIYSRNRSGEATYPCGRALQKRGSFFVFME